MPKKKHILIIDHSVLAYKCFLKLFSQTYQGETNDEIHEFTAQYVREIVYLNTLHQPDGMLWVMDCPRADVWRHRVVRKYYGPRLNVYAAEWLPGTEEKTAENARRWHTECDGAYKALWLDADGVYKSSRMTKGKFNEWQTEYKEENEAEPMKVDRVKLLKKMLPLCAPMYKGNREGAHWPSKETTKDRVQEIAKKLAYALAPLFSGRIAKAEELEADDLACAATRCYWRHDVTAVTTDRDWTILALSHRKDGTKKHVAKFRMWEPNEREYFPTDLNSCSDTLLRKIMSGDKSDNIKSCRLKGKKAGIGDKKADEIFEVHTIRMNKWKEGKGEKPEPLWKWLKANLDPTSGQRNIELVNPRKIPAELYARARDAIKNADRPELPEGFQLTDIVSEAAIHMAEVDGQKKRQEIIIKEGN